MSYSYSHLMKMNPNLLKNAQIKKCDKKLNRHVKMSLTIVF
jgi:hypothetical protein